MRNSIEDLLKEEMEKEAREIETSVEQNPYAANAEVPEGMYDLVMKKIEDHTSGKIYSANADVYVKLSAEDFHALRLGRELLEQEAQNQSQSQIQEPVQQQAQNRTQNQNHRTYPKKKLWLMLASVLVLTVGIGITSVGAKPYILSVVNKVLGNDKAVALDTDETKRIYTEDTDVKAQENQAYDEVREKLGIQMPQLKYLPSGMVFDKSEIDLNGPKAKLFYIYRESSIIYYTAVIKWVDSSYNNTWEDQLIGRYAMMVQGRTINIEEYEIKNSEQNNLVAYFEDGNAFYTIGGRMDKKEFHTMIERLIFV